MREREKYTTETISAKGPPGPFCLNHETKWSSKVFIAPKVRVGGRSEFITFFRYKPEDFSKHYVTYY